MNSTYSRLTKNKEFAKHFTKEYQSLVLSEIICALMENDHISVRKLARESGLAPSFIQNLRSGKQKDIKLNNFMSLSDNLGYELVLKHKINKEEITLKNPLKINRKGLRQKHRRYNVNAFTSSNVPTEAQTDS